MSMIDEAKQLIRERDLSSVVQKFRESGLDEQVSSWVSKGENLPVVGDQIQKALGNDVVAGVAAKLGITTSQAADELAEAVPEVVDEMTPEGELAERTTS
ncbi:MAG: YidB family protein [Actinomycetota bacterium]|nr:YidB family protein [Actinomycetota bacterium]